MPKNRKIRLVVDVNIWVSSLLSLKFQIRSRVFFGLEYRLLVSEELFEELSDAVRKPHLEKRIDRMDYEDLVARLRTKAELVDVHSIVEVCRDPKDNFLLTLAKDGDADYLITGDADLLEMGGFGKTKIVKLTDFERLSLQL